MVSMSSLDAINIDDVFDERDDSHDSYKPFHYVDESSPFKNVFVDVSYIKDCIDTLPNEELTLVLIVLKLTHYIDWSWVWVLSPLWLGWLSLTAILFILALIGIGKTTIKSKNKSLRK